MIDLLTSQDSQMKPLFQFLGVLTAVTAIAGKVMGTMSTTAVIMTASFSACALISGATGYVGFVALAIIINVGILLAHPLAWFLPVMVVK